MNLKVWEESKGETSIGVWLCGLAECPVVSVMDANGKPVGIGNLIRIKNGRLDRCHHIGWKLDKTYGFKLDDCRRVVIF